MDEDKLYLIDGVLWEVDKYNNIALPICPKDKVELTYDRSTFDWFENTKYVNKIDCEDCKRTYKFSRSLYDEMKYVVEKTKALSRKSYEIIDVDGTLTPVTKKEKIGEGEYFCTTQIRDSKRGPQVVIYAGKKGTNTKSQIFITPDERRLSFDQNDINPADIFTKIIAEFDDGTKHIIESGKK